jgi:hypothetical protein
MRWVCQIGQPVMSTATTESHVCRPASPLGTNAQTPHLTPRASAEDALNLEMLNAKGSAIIGAFDAARE